MDNIVLIGFMGCGKTTVGIQLSWKLKMTVEDTDKLIERRFNCTVSEIFETKGEGYFREQETLLLKDLCKTSYKRIISLGGGTPVQPQNKELIKKLGRVVYLRIQPRTVYERLKDDTTRPLLKGENPMKKIETLLNSRSEAYEECADIIIDVDELNVDSVVERILQQI